MFRRARAAVLAGVLAVALAGCGSAAEPELQLAPAPQAPVLADPPPVEEAPPPAPPPPTTTAPPTSRKPKPATAPQAVHQAAAPAPAGVPWVPAGGDEFGGAGLNTALWGAYDSVGAFKNGRRSPDAVSVANGLLTITARGADGGVSGGIGMRKGQVYGRWEFRARTDKGRGFGSAILLWPDSEIWPDDGELDIMEVPGENRDLAHTIIHWGAANNTFGAATRGDFSQWHTFAFEWLPDRLTAYVDGAKTFETFDKAMIPNKPMHVTIQLDQGPAPAWLPPPDETTPPEVRLQVDYVRISALPAGQPA